jgi:hypothetical protein
MLVRNKPQWQAKLTLLYAVTNILAFFAFTRYGLVYTALAFAARALLLFPVSVWCALRLTSLRARDYIATLMPSLLSSVVMAIAVIYAGRLLQDASVLIRVITLVASGAMVYAIVLFLTMPKAYRSLCRGVVARLV